MNTVKISFHILLGFISFLVLIVVALVAQEKAAIISALFTGATFVVYRYVRENRLDVSSLFSFVLILFYAFFYILLPEKVFLEWKSVYKEIIPILLCGSLLFYQKNIQRLLPDKMLSKMHLTDIEEERFYDFFRNIFLIIFLHLGILIYANLKADEQVILFVKREMVIIFTILFATISLIRQAIYKMGFKKGEWLPMVDENGGVKGQVLREYCHGKKKILHPVVHLHLIKDNSVYLQKRPYSKDIQPGMWDTAVGGHISFGESIEKGLYRESHEELGITAMVPRFLIKYVWEYELERELVYTFFATEFSEIIPNKNEIDDGKFWPISQIRDNLGKGVFTPNFEKEFEFLEQIFFS